MGKTEEKKDYLEGFMKIVFIMATTASIVAVALIMFFIFSSAVPTIREIGLGNFIFGRQWKPTATNPKFGILPMIMGSIYATFGAIVLGVPIGVFTAIYMAFYAPKKVYSLLKSGVNLLAGIPSVVYGLFALNIIVPMIRKNFGGQGLSLAAAILVLAIMILPTVISLSEAALRAVPSSYYEGAVGLGASHERAIMTVVLPAAKSGVFSSIILGTGRAIGETMAVGMVAGNQAIMPQGLFKGMRSMTTNIVLEMNYATGIHRDALIATGAVLFLFILAINLVFNQIKKKEMGD